MNTNIIHMCFMGHTEFDGYLRHHIIALSIDSYEHALQQYAHNIPTPLDSNILSYYSLTNNLKEDQNK